MVFAVNVLIANRKRKTPLSAWFIFNQHLVSSWFVTGRPWLVNVPINFLNLDWKQLRHLYTLGWPLCWTPCLAWGTDASCCQPQIGILGNKYLFHTEKLNSTWTNCGSFMLQSTLSRDNIRFQGGRSGVDRSPPATRTVYWGRNGPSLEFIENPSSIDY